MIDESCSTFTQIILIFSSILQIILTYEDTFYFFTDNSVAAIYFLLENLLKNRD